MNFLYSLWLDIRQKAEKETRARAAALRPRYCAANSARPGYGNEFKSIWVDNEDLYESVVTFIHSAFVKKAPTVQPFATDFRPRRFRHSFALLKSEIKNSISAHDDATVSTRSA